MIVTLLRNLWKSATDAGAVLSGNDAPARFSAASEKKRKRLEQEAALQQRRREEEIQQKEHKETSDFWMWLLSEECRRAHRELMADLQDAATAVRLAYEDAHSKELLACAALEDLQRKAIVLPDGRRVYFTRDGIRLYGEDDQEITDKGSLQDAARQVRIKLDAPNYEDFVERRQTRNSVGETVRRLARDLDRLDELQEKVKGGRLGPDEIEAVRKETQDIVEGLPAEFRDRYDQLREARKGNAGIAYHAADPAFDSVPLVHKDFQQAASVPTEKTEVADKPVSAPAYKAAPPF